MLSFSIEQKHPNDLIVIAASKKCTLTPIYLG